MAGFNFGQLQQGLDTAGKIGGVATSLGMAYTNVPKAQSNGKYMARAQRVGQTQFGTTDMSGLMDQWNGIESLPVLQAKDLYNPSAGEMFSSMFGAGNSVMGATSSVTEGLKGKLGTTYINGGNGFNTATNKGWGELGNAMEQQAAAGRNFSGENGFEMADQELSQPTTAQVNRQQRRLSRTLNNAQKHNVLDPRDDINGEVSEDEFFANGGHLFAGGGTVGFDAGSAVSTAINLGMGALGVGLNYLGMKNQREQAEQAANEYNRTRLYSNQLVDHNFKNTVVDTKNNMFDMMALGNKAFGGTLNTQGSDFPVEGDLRYINAGSTHELNPLGGVPQGISSDGQPNLVEEGEVIWDDYVFSDSRRKDKKHKKHPMPDLLIPEDLRKKYKLGGNLTFAQAAKKLSKEAEERPNDPISQDGLRVFLGDLKEAQERVKQEQEAAKLKRAISKMSPEELMHLTQMLQQGQQQVQPEQQMTEVPQEQPMEQMMAMGGHLFDGNTERSAKMKKASDNVDYLLSQMDYAAIQEYGKLYDDYDSTKYEDSSAKENLLGFIKNHLMEADDPVKAFNDGIMNSQLVGVYDEDEIPGYDYSESERKIQQAKDDFTYRTNKYDESLKAANTQGKYGIATTDNSGNERDPEFVKMWNYILSNAEDDAERGITADPWVLRQLQALDERVDHSKGAPRLGKVDSDGKYTLNEGWRDIVNERISDQVPGVFHEMFVMPELEGIRNQVRDTDGRILKMDYDNLNPFYELVNSGTERDGNNTTNYKVVRKKQYSPRHDREEVPVDEVPRLSEIERFAPVLGSAIGALSSLTEKPKDYSIAYAPRHASYEPIGNRLNLELIDTQRYLNAENQQAAAQRNAIMNASGANKNVAMANMAYANRQRQQGMADILNAAEAMNFDRTAKVVDFNRGTDMHNSIQAGENSRFNAGQDNAIIPELEKYNSTMAKTVQDELDAAKSANLTNLFNNIGAIGEENFAVNQVNSNPALYRGTGSTIFNRGTSYYKGHSAKNGGLLTKRNRRK